MNEKQSAVSVQLSAIGSAWTERNRLKLIAKQIEISKTIKIRDARILDILEKIHSLAIAGDQFLEDNKDKFEGNA